MTDTQSPSQTPQQTPGPGSAPFRRYYRNLEPILNKPKNRAYTAAVFSFLAISLFGWYAIRPTVKTILYLRREIQDKTELNKKMEDKISDLIEAQIAYQEVTDRLPLLTEAAPENPDAIDVALQLRNMVNTTQATISGLSISQDVPLLSHEKSTSEPKKDTGLSNFSLSLISDGPYTDLEQLTRNLINMRRILALNSLSIAPDSDNQTFAGDNMLKMIIQVQSYYKP